MDPDQGLYANVFVMDFSSMYPTIMLNCNISPDSIAVTGMGTTARDGAIDWSSDGCEVVIGDRRCSFTSNSHSLVPVLLRSLIGWRAKYRDTMPTFATCMKVAANSVFGALGFAGSPIYSPLTSASVTCTGRWCLTLTFGVLTARGYRVIYGDTDSCFVVATDRVDVTQYKGLEREEQLISHLAATEKLITLLAAYIPPLHGMRLSIDTYDTLVLVGKKSYCYTRGSTMVPRGLAAVRKDRPNFVRKASSEVLDVLTKWAAEAGRVKGSRYHRMPHLSSPRHGTGARARMVEGRVVLSSQQLSMIEDMRRAYANAIMSSTLKLFDVSSIVREGGHMWYSYTDIRHGRVLVRTEQLDGSSSVAYDRSVMILSLQSSLANILRCVWA